MTNPNIENQSVSDIFIKSQLSINQLNHILINNSYIINSIDKKGETLLSYAINNNNYKLCNLLLNNPKLNLYYKDNNGNSYLHLAVKNQNEKIIKKLIEKDTNLNYKNNFGNTPLQMAYEYGNKSIIQLLNNYGMKNLIRNNEHKLKTKSKAKKITNDNKKSNIALKSNKSEFKLLKYNNKSQKRKNGNDNINSNNQKDKSMMISKYCKYYKSNPHFLINNKTSNEMNKNNISNSILTSRRRIKNNIKCLKSNLTKDEEGDQISGTNINNLLNYTSKDTKFITDSKEKSNNVEDISSFNISQSSDSKNNCNEKEKNNINRDNNNDLRRKYIIYDTSYMKDDIEKQNSFENNHKSYINLNKFNTIIQKKYFQLNTDNNYKENNKKCKLLSNQSNKNNLKKANQIATNKIINKTIGITKLKNQNSFNNKINIKNNNNSNKKEKKNNKIYHILKKRNLKRGEIFNLSQNKKENKNKNNLNLDYNKERNQIDENGLTMNSSKLLKDFLSQINMGKYISILAFNGFDDINLILEQSKNGNSSIQDSELKEAGIKIPGDRAKILIRIQELSNNFGFPIPKEVYYSIKNDKNILQDQHIIKLRKWLENLKIEKYLYNFIDNGYNSIELLLIQMISSNPLTNEILKEEIKIDKIGYRSRIINKLKEDSKSFINELKLNMIIVSRDEGKCINKYKNCQCIIL
jgi:ankyrin repeat protein